MENKPFMTIFSCPKQFQGDINIIQRNAIKSWTLLDPKPEVILIGNEEGISEICEEFGLRHISNVEKNEYGTPLISSIFKEAEKTSSSNLMCYVNSDIILTDDFASSIKIVLENMTKFLLIGRRWDIDIKEELNFSGEWKEKLEADLASKGKLHGRWGIDFFVFSKESMGDILPFAIGRYFWDNWLIFNAHNHKISIINITPTTKIIHQNHGYKFKKTPDNEEINRNFKLLGWSGFGYSVLNATHTLTLFGLKRNSNILHLFYETDRFARMALRFIRRKINKLEITKK